ncbi:RteC domain-containing protein [Myroides guanonis]|uniref:RteC domain-containing protein n=1 Tax=Myroides guanonis TaxID=1150112 RepID=UPI00373FDC33
MFSLHYSNAVGDEKTPLIKIIEAFEMIFDKELKADTYKRLSNQKKRKKESTPFLNKISSILTMETQKI